MKPRKFIEGQELLTLALETILQVKEKFKAEHIVDILKGNETSDVKSYQHDELENFAAASDEEESLLHAVIRQAMIACFVSKDIENYGLLKVTSRGKAYLKKPEPFPVVKDKEFEEEEEETAVKSSGGTCAADDVLFSILKDLRKKMSKKLEVPPFVIFQDPSLEAMATSYPITLDELQNIPGVGAGKAKRYGDEFLKLIKEHVRENEIIRPEDLRVRTVANKSKLKVSIIQSIDRKIALDDIALSKGLDISELLDEIEAIVYSGTKINIDYFLEEVMDSDHVDEIFDYFSTAETDKIEPALDELGENDYSETEVRLVRIKFLSEIGN
jgi:ATP-dependent DNA helicase RecQ